MEEHKGKHEEEYYTIPEEVLNAQIWRLIELMPEKGRAFFTEVIKSEADVAAWRKRLHEDNTRVKILEWIIGGCKDDS